MKSITLIVGDDYNGQLDGCRVLFGNLCGKHHLGVLLVATPAAHQDLVHTLSQQSGSVPSPELEEKVLCLSQSAARGVSLALHVPVMVVMQDFLPQQQGAPPTSDGRADPRRN